MSSRSLRQEPQRARAKEPAKRRNCNRGGNGQLLIAFSNWQQSLAFLTLSPRASSPRFHIARVDCCRAIIFVPTSCFAGPGRKRGQVPASEVSQPTKRCPSSRTKDQMVHGERRRACPDRQGRLILVCRREIVGGSRTLEGQTCKSRPSSLPRQPPKAMHKIRPEQVPCRPSRHGPAAVSTRPSRPAPSRIVLAGREGGEGGDAERRRSRPRRRLLPCQACPHRNRLDQ